MTTKFAAPKGCATRVACESAGGCCAQFCDPCCDAIDYRALLVKYMQVVRDQESWSFLENYSFDDSRDNAKLLPEELAHLKELFGETK